MKTKISKIFVDALLQYGQPKRKQQSLTRRLIIEIISSVIGNTNRLASEQPTRSDGHHLRRTADNQLMLRRDHRALALGRRNKRRDRSGFTENELLTSTHLSAVCKFVVFNVCIGIFGFYIWTIFPRAVSNETVVKNSKVLMLPQWILLVFIASTTASVDPKGGAALEFESSGNYPYLANLSSLGRTVNGQVLLLTNTLDHLDAIGFPKGVNQISTCLNKTVSNKYYSSQKGQILCRWASYRIHALRPCFERYPNHRLVNIQPYHSEWRMKSEERCLQFCSDTSSRCRSIVYDAVQHICHFFLDDGYDFTAPAAKMIYLKVVSGTCLESYASSPSETSEVNNFGENPKESTTGQSVSTVPTKQFVVSLTAISSVERDGFSTSSQNFTETATDHSSTSEGTSTEAVQDSQLARPDRGEAIGDMDQEKKYGEQRWKSSREQVMKTTGSPNFEDEQLREVVLFQDNISFKCFNPQRNVQGDVSRQICTVPSGQRICSVAILGIRNKGNNTAGLWNGITTRQQKNGGQNYQIFVTDMLVKVEPPYLTKARSFLNIINNKKNSATDDKRMDYQRPLDGYAVVSSDTGCSVGHVPIWLVFENSVGSESIDSSFAKDWKACRRMCSDEVSVLIPFYSK
ncbi:unnamed protein product [Angiostrongylus costaricensis]|uniref:Apple domain-containing protein n=1 Tax=Angiostrongylus costaricensis TaxID=334426 RepID=A0A3P7J3A0_ANGCS|nr:unnamed protein product [Angiostrongylus costaricensis]